MEHQAELPVGSPAASHHLVCICQYTLAVCSTLPPTAPYPRARMSILYICISIPALEIGPSVPTIQFLFVPTNTYYQRRQRHPTPVRLPGKSHGWRSLVGCSPWGR